MELTRETQMPGDEAIVSVHARVQWPLERILFALAGTMVLLSIILATLVSPLFLLLTAFVGVNQWLYVAFGACPASIALRRVGVSANCRW